MCWMAEAEAYGQVMKNKLMNSGDLIWDKVNLVFSRFTSNP